MAPEYRLHSVARNELEQVFPNLRAAKWTIRSPFDRGYNCHAWGVCESRARWKPTPDDYWPQGLRTGDLSDYTLGNFIRAYSRVGFTKCQNGRYEFGFQKIAIYSEENSGEEWPQHTARQSFCGRSWLSKMGSSEDIKHPSTRDLEGQVYGRVVCYMKRSWFRALLDPYSTWTRAAVRHLIYRFLHPNGN